MSSNKPKVSSHRPPQRARVVRAGSGRRGSGSGGGIVRLLTGPVGLVLLGVAIVLGVGYGVKTYQPANEPATAPQGQVSAPSAQAPKSGTGNAAPVTPAPSVPVTAEPKPSTPPADPNKAILEGRTAIDRSGGAQQTALLKIYYADGLKNGDTLVPVEIRVPFTTSQIKATAEQVVNAPENLKLYSSVPAGTKVQSVNFDTKTGVATVDLSAEASRVQGTAAAANIKASFVYSLTEVAGVKAVQLWVNGRPAMLHGVEWSKPVSRADLQAAAAFKIDPVIKFGAKP